MKMDCFELLKIGNIDYMCFYSINLYIPLNNIVFGKSQYDNDMIWIWECGRPEEELMSINIPIQEFIDILNRYKETGNELWEEPKEEN